MRPWPPGGDGTVQGKAQTVERGTGQAPFCKLGGAGLEGMEIDSWPRTPFSSNTAMFCARKPQPGESLMALGIFQGQVQAPV